MIPKRNLNLYLPPDVRQWIERQAAFHCIPMSEYALRLIMRGIQGETVDELAVKIGQAASGPQQREMLRQILAIRYILEAMANGALPFPSLIGTEANAHAQREMHRLDAQNNPVSMSRRRESAYGAAPEAPEEEGWLRRPTAP